MARARNGTSEYVKPEQRLVLLAWLNGQFGVIGAGLRAFMARKFLDWYLHRRGEMLRSLKGVRGEVGPNKAFEMTGDSGQNAHQKKP